jgi:hypothetical protein
VAAGSPIRTFANKKDINSNRRAPPHQPADRRSRAAHRGPALLRGRGEFVADLALDGSAAAICAAAWRTAASARSTDRGAGARVRMR